MRRILLTIACIVLSATAFASTTIPGSALYSDSYLQRCEGVNALYWNPSRLFTNPKGCGDVILLSSQGSFWNNAMDIDLYNKMNGDSISLETRQEFLDDIDGNYFNSNGHFSGILVAWSKGRNAYSVGTHLYADAKISKEYFDLLLTGNDYGEDYHFTKENNDINVLGYGDLSISHGGYPLHELIGKHFDIEMPKVYIGFTLSALFGGVVAEMKEFEGNFSTSADSTALNLDQTIRFRYGSGGIGMKGLVGLSVEDLVENLSLGFTIDNLPGFIAWGATTKDKYYHISADSVNISEADADTIENEEETKDGETYTTEFPMIFNLGACYTWDDLSVSIDWKQSPEQSIVSSDKPFIALAGEYIIADLVPFRIGYSYDARYDAYSMTYGIGVHTPKFDIDYAIQTYEQIFPSGKAKGSGYSLQLRLKY